MKKFLLVALVAFGMNVKGQITLEHTYDSASTMGLPSTTYKSGQLMIVNFEVSGERYVKINRMGANISIYDMSHSLLKTIDCSGLPKDGYGRMGDVLYLSENLFDTDSGIEFMYTPILPQGSFYTSINNEDGSFIFSDSCMPAIRINVPLQQLPVYNTSQGTKMVLSYYSTQEAKVFSLPGTLTTAIGQANNELLNTSSLVSNPYPNPAINSTRIDYTFPPGVNQGEIVFYDLQGKEVKRYKVDKTFDHLLISTADIQAGTYFYQLQTSAAASPGKKMVVIK